MKKAYVAVGDQLVHYRTCGAGPPVIMLHPSPLSSIAAVPIAQGLARHCEVFAIDTPGYGMSDAPSSPAESLADYLPTLSGFMDALGISRACIYGAATGAQIAIQFALQHPERAALLVLDSCGHLDDDACEKVILDYFPDLTPRADGGHLATVWQIALDLTRFFPWCERTETARLPINQPPADVQQFTAMGYLQAGPEYWRAYAPAFRAERGHYVQKLRVPTVITRWESSIVLGITDDLLAHELPKNVETLALGPTMPDRIDGISNYVSQRYAADEAGRASIPNGQTARFYADLDDGQIHVRGGLQGEGRPVVLLHDPAGSSALMQPLTESFLGTRPVLAVDLPGNGESDPLIEHADISPTNYADVLGQALLKLGVDEVDVIGRYSGGLTGLELARQVRVKVQNLVQSGAMLFTESEAADLSKQYTPDVTPVWNGAHLWTAWYMMRDQALYWPWYDKRAEAIVPGSPRIDPAAIQLRVTELFKAGNRYQQAYHSAFNYPLAERVADCPARLIFASPEWDPLHHKSRKAATLKTDAQAMVLPDRMQDWPAALLPIFDSA